MLSRSSRGAAGLLSRRALPSCRERSLFLTSRRQDVFVRFNSSSNESSDNDKPKFYPRYGQTSGPRAKLPRKNESKSVPLDVEFLGSPGEIVLVQDRVRRRRTPEVQKNPDKQTEESGSLPFFLEELEQERISLDSTVVNERIESVRSSHQPNDKLTATDWEDLRFEVQSSFTYAQLSDYISDNKPNESDTTEEELQNDIVKAAVWKPGVSMFLETDPVSREGLADRVASTQALKGKQLLAERILRDCWQLGVTGEIGQLDIRLPSHSISLLLKSDFFSFEELASLHDAKIDVTHTLGLVRITGKQYTCESIREIVHDATARIREEKIGLHPEGDAKGTRLFSPEFLEWLGKTYGVVFEQNPLFGPSKFFYLIEDKEDAEDARRTLNLALNHTVPPRVPFSTYVPASQPASVYNVEPGHNTSWFDRQKQWFRWAMSSTQSTEAKELDRPIFDKHQTRLSDQLLKLLRRPISGIPNYSNVAGYHETLTASIGKCLFQQKPHSDEQSLSASQLGSMTLPRTFTTDVPRVTSFLQSLTPRISDDSLKTHRIRLVPTAPNTAIFPELDLEVAVSRLNGEDATFAVRGAKAVITESSVDYLLPENGLDLRFTRNVFQDLLDEFYDNSHVVGGVEDVQHTIHECLQRIFSKSRAESPLPAFSHISLPKRFLRKIPPGANNDMDEFVTGEYMFMPVSDIRGTRVHHYDFQDQRVNYSFYESGPFLPDRTTDMFLDMVVPNKGPNQAQGQANSYDLEFNTFYKTACKLAFELDNTWRMS
ncbi:hypothetical protein ASPWEDRAFT_37223 [Aspergillus wentii DTO 134E9]|uniref:Mitochondrial inner-membrane-bound regulator-domain-containing protein n=1 Tax=Aspergillus wentii DTO 134E9 TaxID=1073089 RepID=A0A1L9RWW5_ASPWE|nr:uncharacterized protein ASPWEDRAFT_37223 [Aspergillus wentii DTO 134E9]KAI9931873.1 hypothetical protein MW887_010457 [Aspergillus wentii]OJJ39441.1 hypothetical protein ASPWEDRAFT_37223 [Aspergillus wentii DTO 134E9]